MPDQSTRSSSRDFAFQSTDQSFGQQLGGAEGASQSPYSTQPHDRYEAGRATNAQGGPATQNQASAQDPSLRYSEFGAQQSPVLPQANQGQFPGYGFSPGGPLVWDWGNSIDFAEFTNHYEPQGELVQELQNQNIPANDFSIPLPVANAQTIYQSPQQTPSAHSVTVQNPLSPPPKPPQKPTIQTGMKRKAESEPNSAVSQNASASTELQEKPVKRPNKSRASSTASITSPVVATSTASEAKRPSMTQTAAATEPAESASQGGSNTNAELQKRKEPSKGTGPQGRVIDVSKPRRIVESPAGADILPAGKVFPIQIGSELFRLSGASLSSDGKHYP